MSGLLSIIWEVIEVLSVLFSFFGLSLKSSRKYYKFRWNLFQQKRKWEKTENKAKGYVMLIALKKHLNNAKSEVQELTEEGGYISQLKGLPVMTYELPDICKASDSFEVIEWVKSLRSEMAKNNKREIHLLYAGPGMILAQIGAELGNASGVFLYQFNPPQGKYEFWGKLWDPTLLAG